jgi:hypothetical protein
VLQIGVVLLDRFRYETPISRGQWAAVVVVIAAQAYLLLGGSPAAAAVPRGDHVIPIDHVIRIAGD